MSDELVQLRKERDEAAAEVAACLEFLDTELGWEYFREEMLYPDNEEQRSASMKNAQKLKNFLAEKGHGISLLRELHQFRLGQNCASGYSGMRSDRS